VIVAPPFDTGFVTITRTKPNAAVTELILGAPATVNDTPLFVGAPTTATGTPLLGGVTATNCTDVTTKKCSNCDRTLKSTLCDIQDLASPQYDDQFDDDLSNVGAGIDDADGPYFCSYSCRDDFDSSHSWCGGCERQRPNWCLKCGMCEECHKDDECHKDHYTDHYRL